MQSTENQTLGQADQVAASTPSPKQCPFCSGSAVVTFCYEPIRYGVRCTACQVMFLPILETKTEAITLWNRRSGGGAAAGGRATAGRCSRRKMRAAKRNLRKARQQKQLKHIRSKIEVLMPQFRAAMAEEQEWANQQAAASRQRLQQRLNDLRDHPGCADLVRQIEEDFGKRLRLERPWKAEVDVRTQ